MDLIANTPRNPFWGLLSDGVQGVADFAAKPFGYDNPPGGLLSNALGLPAVARTLDRVSYGEPLTTGTGFSLHLKDDTLGAALAALPLAGAAFKAAPTVGRGLLAMADNAMAPTAAANLQRGAINVYHGSPHSFDAYDMSKIGTGEGAQAYGHGLYFAENPSVAQDYQKALAKYKTTIDGVPLTPQHPQFSAGMSIAANGYDRALANAQSAAASGFVNPQAAAKEIADIQALQGAKIQQVQGGSVYNTRLAWPDAAREAADPLGPQHFLQWDKPLSEQPALMQKLGQEYSPAYLKLFQDMPASEFYKAIAGGEHVEDMRPAATNALRQQGIPGIRYMDQGSRGAGQGSANYVVFDDKIPTITGRK